MKIVLTGDVFVGGDLHAVSAACSVNHRIYNQAEVRIINLEQPVSDSDYVESKSTIYTGSEALEKLAELNVDAVNLAHNHIQDKGLPGISETVTHLDSASIRHFGAGKSMDEASEPCWILSDVALLGYCDFDRPYLRQVALATENQPGVAPLRKSKILKDLDKLPDGKRAILYFHWGQEHVWLPPHHDIQLARELLEDDRVALIVGMHSHRPQGYVQHNGKRAYMCLGNFLFPNFFIAPPTQLTYLRPSETTKWVTRRYQAVNKITYKKWKRVNRTSLLVEWDASSRTPTHSVALQRDNVPVVDEPGGLYGKVVLIWVELLSAIYRLPRPIYVIAQRINSVLFYAYWRTANTVLRARQGDMKCILRKAIMRVRFRSYRR